MANYYEILGITYSASAAEIRAAYKKLAMRYHPDHNPGSKEAEEMFKVVNEAYHTLSDGLKKSRYDSQINLTYATPLDYQREINKMRYYQWQRMQEKHYRIDKEYVKIQGLAFLVFTVIAGFCFAIIHSAQYYTEQQQLARFLATSNALKHVDTLFNKGQFDEAFKTIYELKTGDPLEYRYNYARDSLVHALRTMANQKFNTQDFSGAVQYYRVLKNHEDPASFETIRQLSLCQYYLGNYKESVQSLKQLHNLRPYNLELVYRIGMLNLEKLENPEEALYYFSYGKKIFKENLSEIYGAAFEVIMNPADAPDIYFDLFEARARTNIQLKNFEEAVTDCNWAIFLRRERSKPYILRATANVELQNLENVCTDLSTAKRLGDTEMEPMYKRYCKVRKN
ncbi:DnaJ domain-containing protein [Chryseolinea sp. H1M3-3]|uniref:DnaJ domain-containing protein n=1 Tax=Chryseolinea sp. H1M3-3 TaxID=3034144 RepID=UPI0023EAF906|nr:DnaJ domain-containing protein [Chryseolinea sp. H1M3-3]